MDVSDRPIVIYSVIFSRVYPIKTSSPTLVTEFVETRTTLLPRKAIQKMTVVRDNWSQCSSCRSWMKFHCSILKIVSQSVIIGESFEFLSLATNFFAIRHFTIDSHVLHANLEDYYDELWFKYAMSLIEENIFQPPTWTDKENQREI